MAGDRPFNANHVTDPISGRQQPTPLRDYSLPFAVLGPAGQVCRMSLRYDGLTGLDTNQLSKVGKLELMHGRNL
jgi:hypothetical protein